MQRLVFEGCPLDIAVMGDEIELGARMDSHFLVATADDYFDGCSHWFYLLDPALRLLDAVSMPDTFGFLQNVEQIAENALRFSYFGTNDSWHLEIDQPGRHAFSPNHLLRRPNRFLLAKRHLLLKCTKGPKWQPKQDS